MIRPIAGIGAMLMALVLAACGGSDSSSPAAATPGVTAQAAGSTPAPAATRPAATPTVVPTPTNQQILAYAKQYLRTEWNFLAGSALPKDLYDMFVPDCQKAVTVEALAKTPAAVQAAYSGLKGVFLQDITFSETLGVRFLEGNALQIIVPKFSQAAVTINGKQQSMYIWVQSISATPVQDESRSFRIAQVGTTLKMASCETLTQWARN